MINAIIDWIKNLVSGKSSTQLGGSQNQAANVGTHNGPLIQAQGDVHFNPPAQAPPQRVPTVHVSCAVTVHPLAGAIYLVSITVTNPMERSLFLRNVMLEMNNNQNIFVPKDGITDEAQTKREIRPGDDYAFHITDKQFIEVGRPSSDYLFAVAQDATGTQYKSEPGKLAACVADMLRDRPIKPK